MSDFMSDEALARRLQQEEDDKLDAIYQNDLALAQSLQQESVVDLTSDHSDSEDKATQKNFWLALTLQQQEDDKNSTVYEDFELAKQLQNQVDDSILDQDIPDVHQLFMYFNKKYFHDMLTTVDVRWSHKMTRWYKQHFDDTSLFLIDSLVALVHVLIGEWETAPLRCQNRYLSLDPRKTCLKRCW